MLDDYDKNLLKSVKAKAKYLHIGYSPVSAIDRGFRLANEGYLHIKDGWVTITPKGLEALNETMGA
jgi:Mn-dependent DtxR family transcriptional regulator